MIRHIISYFKLIKYVIYLNRIPRYIIDYWYVPFKCSFIWRNKGMSVDQRVVWSGIPIISIFPQSKILIGKKCVICSRSSQTAMGINHPVVLRTLRVEAELRIGDGVRMSGTTICAGTTCPSCSSPTSGQA